VGNPSVKGKTEFATTPSWKQGGVFFGNQIATFDLQRFPDKTMWHNRRLCFTLFASSGKADLLLT